MSNSNTNLSPDKEGEDLKKKLSIDYELIEFNLVLPKVVYDLFQSLIPMNRLFFDCNGDINHFIQKQIICLLGDIIKDVFKDSPTLLENYSNLIKQFILDTW